MEQRNMAMVRRAVQEIGNKGDLEVADVLFGPTYVNHGGLIPDLVHGPEAIKSAIALYRLAFPTLHITLEHITADGEMVTVLWTARGSRSPGDRHASTGQALRGTLRCLLIDGQIVESWMHWDSAAVLRDLGLR